jgi:choline dehydrogenase-like flavoprotein
MDANLTTDFDLISELSAQGRYDYIIVGSGLGGGILARKLVEGKKRVLLIEKGGLTFSTHCLNTSRPHWQIGSVQGPSQDNDVVYNACKQKVQTAAGSDPYVGGPVYCLGGRSTVWGLFAPEIGKNTYPNYFPKRISDYLGDKGYGNAFTLLTNGSQKNGLYPMGGSDISTTEVTKISKQLKDGIEAFYEAYGISSIPSVALAPIAAEFTSPSPYQFPQGAYSTVDALLDKVYARDQYLTILLNAEVLRVSVNKIDDNTYESRSLTVRTLSSQRLGQIYAKEGIILCAGTIGTAKIALNSGLQDIHSLVGKGLTDHEIWGVRFAKEKAQKLKDPLKLQSEITVCGTTALLNVVVNANTFFGRNSTTFAQPVQYFDRKGKLLKRLPDKLFQGTPAEGDSTDYDTINLTLEYAAELFDSSEVLNIPAPDPVILARRLAPRQDENSQAQMQTLATAIRKQMLGISDDDSEPAPRLSLAGFGVVAHEVGTMRLQIPQSKKGYVVNDKYQVRKCPNLYVCDLSIFPFSPPANPSLTLAALALQLADDLLS